MGWISKAGYTSAPTGHKPGMSAGAWMTASALAADGQQVVVLASGTVWNSDDGGQSFTPRVEDVGTRSSEAGGGTMHESHDTGTAELYVCPMHPEVTDDHASDCPECGMRLVPAGDAAKIDHHHEPSPNHLPRPKRANRSTRPMHLEIVRDQPGRCPICGMHSWNRLFQPGRGLIARGVPRHVAQVLGGAPLSLVVLSIAMFKFPALPEGDLGVAELILTHSCGPLGSRAVLRGRSSRCGTAPQHVDALIGLAWRPPTLPVVATIAPGSSRTATGRWRRSRLLRKPPPSSAH